MKFLKVSKQTGKILSDISKVWDGKKSIMDMKKVNFSHWKQMEWIGFYFQFLYEKHLCGIMEIPGPKYGNVKFDDFKDIPWDFKAHAINTSNHLSSLH